MPDAEGSRLVLIRHGPPVIDPTGPPASWALADPVAVERLAPLLPLDLAVVASDERKAIGTAAALGRAFSVDARLREVSRPWIGSQDEFVSACRRYLRGEQLAGWEPQEQARARFAQAARGIVVAHGTIMSLFVAARCPGIDVVEFFEGLEMPDVWVLDDAGLRRPRQIEEGS